MIYGRVSSAKEFYGSQECRCSADRRSLFADVFFFPPLFNFVFFLRTFFSEIKNVEGLNKEIRSGRCKKIRLDPPILVPFP